MELRRLKPAATLEERAKLFERAMSSFDNFTLPLGTN